MSEDEKANERFVSPCKPPEGMQRELVTILMEECAEVTQRASKLLRFGIEEIQPGQPNTNSERLAMEVGDLIEVIDRVIDASIIDAGTITAGRLQKRRQLDKFMQFRSEATP